MPHVIGQSCCNDTTCVDACPVNCIHPARNEPGYAQAETLFIDPAVCIDCGACVDVCPVGAISHENELSGWDLRYAELNAVHAEGFRATLESRAPTGSSLSDRIFALPTPAAAQQSLPVHGGPLRVAIIGSGPAGCYAAEHLLTRRDLDVEVHMFERLPTPWGLVRFGVAPDHPETKDVIRQFRRTAARPGFSFHLNVDVGRDFTHEELAQHFHAVIYAVGASSDRSLGIAGEDLPGSHAATDFVAWYNGHPDAAGRSFDLSGERAVIVGNGNVALDVARILLTPVEHLAGTDIADHALAALRESRIREVVVLGRRGPAQAAYSVQELLGLGRIPGVQVTADPAEVALDPVTQSELDAAPDPVARYKATVAENYAASSPDADDRRIVLRFLGAPLEIMGADRVEGLRISHNHLVATSGAHVVNDEGETVSLSIRIESVPTGREEVIETGLVLRSVGYRGKPQSGVPFDDARGTLPNLHGRVVDPALEAPVPGIYTTGWIKRGPSGVIGTNRGCAAETVDSLVTDFLAEALPAPTRDRADLDRLLAERCPARLDYAGWKAIDMHERNLTPGRRRTKLVDVGSMLAVAQKGDRS